MPLTLHPIPATLPALHTLSVVERQAFEDPPNALMELFFPLTVQPSREACIDEAAVRQLKWLNEDPTATWVGVFDGEGDTGDGKAVLLGAALWHVYETDPYADESVDGAGHGGGHRGGGGEGEGMCTWFPPGDQRHLADALMGQLLVPRTRYMRRPHVFLDILFTSPLARRRGVGRLLMSYGIQIADEKNLPCYIDATGVGRKLYETCGFVAAPTWELSLDGVEEVAERVEGLTRALVPFEWWPMWRGRMGGGDGEEKGEKAPWDGER